MSIQEQDKLRHKSLEDFYKHLEAHDSDYPWIAKDLPENPTLEQRMKFEICQKIIDYKKDHNLNYEQLSEIILKDYKEHLGIETKIEKVKKILFCWISDLPLKELETYVSYLSLPIKLDLAKLETEKTSSEQLDEWDSSLNDQKILEIISQRLNHKTFEPLPEPFLLWKEEVYFVETAYRGIKYQMIFKPEKEQIHLRNIWVL